MRKTTVLVIAPYEGLLELLKAEGNQRDHLDIMYEIGDLDKGLAIAQQYQDREIDVILSRGGTARLIAANVDTPVISIETSVIDLLHVVRFAQNHTGNFAIVGFPNITANAAPLLFLLPTPIEVITIKNSAEADAAIQKLKEKNISLIVGDAIAVTTAQKFHINGLIISSGTESVIAAFDEVERLARHIQRANEKCRMLESMQSLTHTAAFMYTPQGQRLYPDPVHRLPLDPDTVHYIESIVTAQHPQDEITVLHKAEAADYRITVHRITLFSQPMIAVLVAKAPQYYLSDLKLVPVTPAQNRRYLLTPIDNIGQMSAVFEQAAAAGASDAPVILYAPQGTPVEQLARAMAEHSVAGSQSMLFYDFAVHSARSIENLISKDDSYLNENHQFLVFQNLETLHSQQIDAWTAYTEESLLHRRNKAVYVCKSKQLPAHSADFIYRARCIPLEIPALKNRIDDLPYLVNLYLNRLDIELGHQVSHIDAEGMQLLMRYPWPGNNQQLVYVLRELLRRSHALSVSKEEVEHVLQHLPSVVQPLSIENLKEMGTLDEINRQVVTALLQEKSMSKAQLAQHLGISRSTLWRILSSIEG